MSSFNSFFNGLFGAVWTPFRSIDPWVGLAVLSALVGILALIAMKYCSNQTRIAQLKDSYKAHVLAIKLFRDDLGIVLKSLGRTLVQISFYMGHQLRPMAVMMIPFVFLFAQMQMRLAYKPLDVGDKVNVTVQMENWATGSDGLPEEVTVEFPDGLELAGAKVHAPTIDRVMFPMRATKPGVYDLKLTCGSETVTKQIHVGMEEDLTMLSPMRSSSTTDLILYPTEEAFGDGSAFASIQVPYPVRELPLLGIDWSFGFELGMGLTFMILSIVVALLFKGVFGVTI